MNRVDKKRIFDIIQIGQTGDTPSKLFDLFIVSNILLNILSLILLTFRSLSPYFQIFQGIEWVTTFFFCLEYALRIWTAEYLYGEKGIKSVLRFMVSFDGIIDLFTILPFFFLGGFIAFRFLRVARIFHLFRIVHYLPGVFRTERFSVESAYAAPAAHDIQYLHFFGPL